MSIGDSLSDAISQIEHDLAFRGHTGRFRNQVEALVELMTMLRIAVDTPEDEEWRNLRNWFLDAFDAAVDLSKINNKVTKKFKGKTARQWLSEALKEGRKRAREDKKKFDEEFEAWRPTEMAD